MLAGYPALWLFSALLHMVDADLNGLEGFFALTTMPSVYLIAALLFIPCILAVMGFRAIGVGAYWFILIVSAVMIGAFLTIGGSTASDFWGYAVSFGGITLISSLFMMPGTLPGVLFLKMSQEAV